MTTDKIWHQLPERQAAIEVNHISPVQGTGAAKRPECQRALPCTVVQAGTPWQEGPFLQHKRRVFFFFVGGWVWGMRGCIQDSVTELTDQSYHA